MRKNAFLYVIISFVMSLVISLSLLTEVNAASAEFEEKRVLFISSYSSSFPTYFQQIEGLNDSFEAYPITVDVEFMDSKRFFNTENIQLFTDLIEYKLSLVNYDLVITSDDNAINFVMDHRDDLFADLPVIFFGVNNASNAKEYALNTDVTGVIEDVSIGDTINFALECNPTASKLVVLVDSTVSGQSDLASVYELENDYSNLEFNTINMSDMILSDYFESISNIGDDSIVLLLAALRDIDGNSIEFHESVRLILDESNQPVYHLYEHGISDGLIGGRVVSHYNQATIAASMAIDYFNGKNISDIELVEESPNLYMINYETYKDYGFRDSMLPNDTVFINREYSLFEQYTLYFVIGIAFILAQSTIIALLMFNISQKKKAYKIVEKNTLDLEKANDLLTYKTYHDDLTDLYNRNYFEKTYPELFKDNNENNVAIIILDVNGLKLINDAFGHSKGDEALKATASALKEVFIEDAIYRIGGDDFVVLTSDKDEIEIARLINSVKSKLDQIQIGGLSISVSVGYAVTKDGITSHEIFREAEDWMYREKLSDVPSNRSAMIDTIIATVNQKDIYSEEHSKRVSALSVKIASLLELSENQINEIKTAGLLHDIGKIIVPSTILNKKGRLLPLEYEEMKKHPEIGYRILNSVSSMTDIADIVLSHHERIDGKGYPRGLTKDEIPFQSLVIAIADAIDAMLSDRLYRPKMSKEECFNELEKNKGTQFCTKIVDVVLEHFDEIYEITQDLNTVLP